MKKPGQVMTGLDFTILSGKLNYSPYTACIV